jgi:hypothetical protein
MNLDNLKNIIVWGFKHYKNKDNGHTHSYIHEMMYNTFLFMFPNKNVLWLENNNHKLSYDNTLFFVSPTHGDYDKLPINNNSYYIFHIDDFEDNLGMNTDDFKNSKYYDIIKNNKGIILYCRKTDTMNYFDENVKEKYINLPWGVFSNIHHLPFKSIKKSKYITYFGSTWYLNKKQILNISEICEKNKFNFLITGRNKHEEEFKNFKFTKIDNFNKINKNNTINRIKNNFGIKFLLAIQGEEHIGNYISDRVFKFPLYGYICFTNNWYVKKYFKSAIYEENMENLINIANKITSNKKIYKEILNLQIEEIKKNHFNDKRINLMINFLNKIS